MTKIILLGNPISNNSLYKRGRGHSFYMTDEAKALKENYQWQAKNQYKGKPLKGKLEIKVRLFFSNKRKHDWDNYGKLTDALNNIVWIGDEQIYKATIIKGYDSQNPRVEIIVDKVL